VELPKQPIINTDMLVPPLPEAEARQAELEKTPNITSLPELGVIADELSLPVLLKLGDDISTDDIMPAGARVLPFWSNIPKTSEFTFEPVDPTYPRCAGKVEQGRGHAIVAGNNYGQGSSRENAALAPRYLGLCVVLAKSFARIHWQNLVNFGVLPLTFADPGDYDRLGQGEAIQFTDVHAALRSGHELRAKLVGNGREILLHHDLSPRQIDLLLVGGVINWLRQRLAT
jgi:aconitate hydratase